MANYHVIAYDLFTYVGLDMKAVLCNLAARKIWYAKIHHDIMLLTI